MIEAMAFHAEDLLTSKQQDLRFQLASGQADRCEFCGDIDYYGYRANHDVRGRFYQRECPECNTSTGMFWFRVQIEHGKRTATVTDSFIIECGDSDCPRIYPGPFHGRHIVDECTYALPTPKIVSNQIEEHHVSYEPEITIPLCSDCHGRAHSDSPNYEGLKPGMKRNEWENA